MDPIVHTGDLTADLGPIQLPLASSLAVDLGPFFTGK